MAMPFLDSLKSQKLDNKSNLNSFWASILFIAMYISAFYIFNLSPSTLIRSTKFWFIISNTLILIIAVDSGAFSSSKTLHFSDKNNNLRRPTPNHTAPPAYFHIKYDNDDAKTRSNHHHAQEEIDDDVQPREKIIGVVVASDHHHHIINPTQQTLPRKPQIFVTHREKNYRLQKVEEEDENNSQLKKVEENEEEEVATLSENGEEEDEFSRMSNEEVNRRVEEFIRRFNTQIRLQAVKN